MLKHWLQQSTADHGGNERLAVDTQTIALHVLSFVGFGVQQAFGEDTKDPKPGYTMAFYEALNRILANLLLAIVIPETIKTMPFMSVRMQKLAVSMTEYKQYVNEMLRNERDSKVRASNLTSVLVRASDDERKTEDGRTNVVLSDEEIVGNMFIFNVAGHDTTANTMAFGFALLSVYPEVQDWLHEEITHTFGDKESPDYETMYPQLRRCLAVLVCTHR